MQAQTANPGWGTIYLAAGLIVLAGVAAYAHSGSGPFIYDDLPTILDNVSIRHLRPIWGVLHPPHGDGLTAEGRPVFNLSLALNYAWGGVRPAGYHAVNAAIHLLAGLTLFGILRRTVGARSVAFGAALLWTVHPLQTEAVTYVVQRAESLMGLFYLLTLYGFVRGRPVLSVLACLLGMATKEAMITAPVMVFFYDRTFRAGSFREAWRQRRSYYLALAATWLLLLVLIAGTGGNRSGSIGFGTGVSAPAYWLTQTKAIVTYLRLAAVPAPLVLEHGTFWLSPAAAAPYAAAVLALAAATAWALVRAPAWGFLGFWFFGILAPTCLAPGTTQMIVEHRMYLPLAAIAVAFAVLARAAAGRRGLAIVAVLAVAFGVLTDLRNRRYRTALSIWGDTVEHSPGSARAQSNLASALIAAGRPSEGLEHFATAVRLDPNDAVAANNYGVALRAAGRGAEAVGQFELALRLRPAYPNAHYNLANALADAGRPAEAIPHYEAALRAAPDYLEAAYNLGDTLLQIGRPADAARAFRQVLRIAPDNADAAARLRAIGDSAR